MEAVAAAETALTLRPARSGFTLKGRFMTAVSVAGVLGALALSTNGQGTDALLSFGALGVVFGTFWASILWSELRTVSPWPPEAVVVPEPHPLSTS